MTHHFALFFKVAHRALSFFLFLSLIYVSSTHAQCASTNVSLTWAHPPQVEVTANDSIRWPIDGSISFGYLGSWCPSPEEISLIDETGTPIPAVIHFGTPVQLVENGPTPISYGRINPMMSLEPRTDYTLTLSPPNPELSIYEDYQVTFRTARTPMESLDGFEGIKSVEIDGDVCFNGLTDSNADNFNCVIPSYFNLRVNFKPLPEAGASYMIYRASSIPTASDDEGEGEGLSRVEDINEVEYLLAYLPGVRSEQTQRSLNANIQVLYSPLPREACFMVVAVDEWGRERGGRDQVQCISLSVPSGCPDRPPFPPPLGFPENEPIFDLECESIGIHGASGRTPTPPLSVDNDAGGGVEAGEEEADNAGGEEDEDEDPDESLEAMKGEGCVSVETSRPTSALFILMMSALFFYRRRA